MTPTIFVSAVSRELKSARQLVANTLQFMGYTPVWQDTFGTEQGDLREVLRSMVDKSQGVVQLVGHRYGAEPLAPDEKFGRVSYTQYEALYAKQQGKKVWYIVLADDFPTDAADPEPAELAALQQAYHKGLDGGPLYHPVSATPAIEASVLKLRSDLWKLRRGVRRWAIAASMALVLILGLSAWLLAREFGVSRDVQKGNESIARTENALEQQRAILDEVLRRTGRTQQAGENLTPQQRFDSALEAVARDQHQPVEELRAKINLFVKTVEGDPTADPLDKARAALATQQNDAAAKISADVGADAKHDYEVASNAASEIEAKRELARSRAYEAYLLEGQAHYNAIRYPLAIDAFRQAIEMADQAKNTAEWCAAEVELGISLGADGKYAEAEKEDRAVLAVRERMLGPEHRETLNSRNNLAAALSYQGKYAEAGKENRAVLALRQRMLGSERPDTLRSRSNAAADLANDGKDAEAEKEYRAVIAVRERVLGPEHPDTLLSRSNLANTLSNQGKYAEAEKEDRAVFAIQERVLGPEHPDTLLSRSNLANMLSNQGKYAEAEEEDRAVLTIQERVLGPEHPDTLLSRSNLAHALRHQGNYAEAEDEYRAVLAGRERALGPTHPKTLDSYFNLSWCELMVQDFMGALACATAGLKASDHWLPLETNRAHALLFLGRFDEAKHIYLQHVGEKVDGTGKSWDQTILKDFDALEKQGVTSPDVQRIRDMLKSRTP